MEVKRKFLRFISIFIPCLFLFVLLFMKVPGFLLLDIVPGLTYLSILILFSIGFLLYKILFYLRQHFLFKYIYTIGTYFRLRLFFRSNRKKISLKKITIFNFLILKKLLFKKNLELTIDEIMAIERNIDYFRNSLKVLVKALLYEKTLRGRVILPKKNLPENLLFFAKINSAIKEQNPIVLDALFQKDLLELLRKNAGEEELLLKVLIWLIVFESIYHEKDFSGFLLLNYERIASVLYNLKGLDTSIVKYINSRYYPVLRRKKVL